MTLFPALSERSEQRELMDDADGADRDADSYALTLRQLGRINLLTNGYLPTIEAVKTLARRAQPGQSIRVLDVGYGYGDTLRALERWSKYARVNLELIGIDLNPAAKARAEAATAESAKIDYRVGDVFSLENESFDIIINSLFMHHLSDQQIIRVLSWMTSHSDLGWFINDLHRHPVAFHFIRHATRLTRCTPMIQHDAPLSVARSFTREEWRAYLHKANVPEEAVRIRWSFPFRYGILFDCSRIAGGET